MIDRRTLLSSLASIPPFIAFTGSKALTQESGSASKFLRVSRILVGGDDLTPGAASRIEKLLRARDIAFDSKLSRLAQSLLGGGNRDEGIKRLGNDDLAFALEVAHPWYLGYLGTPSGRILEDDAEFTTFLEAQCFSKVRDFVPLRTYPPGNAGWWQAAPDGVDASDLPAAAASWDYQPRDSFLIRAPDPGWRAYAEGRFATVEEARASLANPVSSPETGGAVPPSAPGGQ
jgi:hypothetical protein